MNPLYEWFQFVQRMTTGSGSTHSWVFLVLKKYPGIYTPAILYEIIISSTLLRIYFFCLFFWRSWLLLATRLCK